MATQSTVKVNKDTEWVLPRDEDPTNGKVNRNTIDPRTVNYIVAEDCTVGGMPVTNLVIKGEAGKLLISDLPFDRRGVSRTGRVFILEHGDITNAHEEFFKGSNFEHIIALDGEITADYLLEPKNKCILYAHHGFGGKQMPHSDDPRLTNGHEEHTTGMLQLHVRKMVKHHLGDFMTDNGQAFIDNNKLIRKTNGGWDLGLVARQYYTYIQPTIYMLKECDRSVESGLSDKAYAQIYEVEKPNIINDNRLLAMLREGKTIINPSFER